MQIKHQRFAAIFATSAVAAFGLSACGSSNDNSSSTSSGSAASTQASTGSSTIAVPEAIKSKGTLVVASDASYAPNEFIASDGKTVEGADADLAKAIGKELGLKVEVKNVGFDSIIPGLAAKKYDLGMSSFTDTKEREQTVDFVTYFNAGTSFYTKAQGGTEVTGLDDLCGKTVAVEKGTTQADDSTAQSKKCKAAGKPEVKVSTFPDQNGANLAIQSGRAQIGMADSPVAAYQVKKSNGQFKLVGTPYGEAPYGIAIPKGSGLDEPVLAAVKQMIADGTYKQILTKWGIEAGAISNPVINGAQS
ncbi:MAG TPA: ABC transporter substrate-binding protein [Baekduia sp.]|uniref:ABC transporter substrate-binding protein n=1 Tax=Baekduia sp. TaxID=2600305 RepID=UPI002D76822D|nr:ABC transporter substrate-binding protein [Baekduia sp.]HET6507231.1 ABC transporter substrate-binding protein [Baekduia sp.]